MRYSLVIKITKNISLEGNDNLIWYIKNYTKDTNDLESIFEALKKYKEKYRKKGKINIIVIGDIDKNIIEKYKDYFNIFSENDIQKKITEFINK
jgi:wyosine [tRNA(Phe)-imidazoG37] synthetase (radical SAM superfamily)